METEVIERYIFAIVVILAALAIFAGVAWMIRNQRNMLQIGNARSQRRRLEVVESVAVDAKRRLVLVRLDDDEHLILTGGPADLVIGPAAQDAAAAAHVLPPQHARVAPARQQTAAPQRASRPAAHEIPYDDTDLGYEMLSQPAAQPVVQQQAPATPPQSKQTNAGRAQGQPESFPRPPSAADAVRQRMQANRQAQAAAPTPPPADDDDFTYGPGSAQVYTQEEPAVEQSVAPPKSAASAQTPPSGELTLENAQSLLEAARNRLKGNPEAPVAAEPESPQSAFARVLDGRQKPGDIPARQQPNVRPGRQWSPPPRDEATGRAKPQASNQPRPTQMSRESDESLEEKVALILEELQNRRNIAG